MKRLISFILIFTYLAAVFQVSIPYLSYYTNYSYFAEEACINKHNPELKCNGQCQLKKMVKNQHDHDETIPDDGVQIVKTSSSTIFFTVEQSSFFYYPSISSRTFSKSTKQSSQHISEPVTPPPVV